MTIRAGRLDLSPSNRTPIVTDGDVRVHRISLFRSEADAGLSPDGFLVDQPPGAVIRTHFHGNSQWQVFVGGSGTLGRRPVQGFVAQYVAPHTGYGPIAAGDRGLWYMTLRPSVATGAHYLPESREQLDATLPKLQLTSELFLPDAVNAEQPQLEMIAPRPDGLAAWMVWLAPDTTVPAPEHPGGLARYYVVTRGELLADGNHLGPLSVAWTDGGDLAMPLRAGRPGLSVMVLQFPGNAW